jgi:hypothetical protein
MPLPTDVNSSPNYTAAEHATHHNQIHTHVNAGGVSARYAMKSNGDFSVVSNTPAVVDAALDLTVPAVAGDRILVGVSGSTAATTNQMNMSVASLVSGSLTNYWSSDGGTNKIMPGGIFVVNAFTPFTITAWRTIVSGDISGGNLVVRLCPWVSTSARTLHASAATPLQFWLQNWGQ